MSPCPPSPSSCPNLRCCSRKPRPISHQTVLRARTSRHCAASCRSSSGSSPSFQASQLCPWAQSCILRHPAQTPDEARDSILLILTACYLACRRRRISVVVDLTCSLPRVIDIGSGGRVSMNESSRCVPSHSIVMLLARCWNTCFDFLELQLHHYKKLGNDHTTGLRNPLIAITNAS